MKKYQFTGEEKQLFGRTLKRIQAAIDFGNVKAGDIGGWIEKENNLSQIGSAWVSGNARVSGDAWVSGNAGVSGDAQVFGDAQVYSNARVSGGDGPGQRAGLGERTVTA